MNSDSTHILDLHVRLNSDSTHLSQSQVKFDSRLLESSTTLVTTSTGKQQVSRSRSYHDCVIPVWEANTAYENVKVGVEKMFKVYKTQAKFAVPSSRCWTFIYTSRVRALYFSLHELCTSLATSLTTKSSDAKTDPVVGAPLYKPQ